VNLYVSFFLSAGNGGVEHLDWFSEQYAYANADIVVCASPELQSALGSRKSNLRPLELNMNSTSGHKVNTNKHESKMRHYEDIQET
jgi:hypothetical protein